MLREAGVKRVVTCSTVGAVNRAIRSGDLVIAADIIEPTQTPYSLLPGRQKFDASGKQIVCTNCATILAETASRLWPSEGRVHGIEQGLVAGHAYGPRLTTPAEAMMFRTLGADVINHSIAPEATLSREIGACFTPCAFVTATMNDYLSRDRGTLLQAGVLGLGRSGLITMVGTGEHKLGADCRTGHWGMSRWNVQREIRRGHHVHRTLADLQSTGLIEEALTRTYNLVVGQLGQLILFEAHFFRPAISMKLYSLHC